MISIEYYSSYRFDSGCDLQILSYKDKRLKALYWMRLFITAILISQI